MNGITNGFIDWAEEQQAALVPNGHSKAASRPASAAATAESQPTADTVLLERLADAERRAAAAEGLRSELARVDSDLRRAQVELDGERSLRSLAEQGRVAAESRLAEAREALWRWLARLARTPFWRLRRALAEPPVELEGQRRLPPPTDA